MFSFNPEMAVGDSIDDGEEAFDSYLRDEDADEDANSNVSYIIIITSNKSHLILKIILKF